MSVLILINYQDNLLQFEFDENANVGDLKNRIQDRTNLIPSKQQLVLSSDFDITDDIPLIALGIEEPVLLLEKEVPRSTQSPQISRPVQRSTNSNSGYSSHQTSIMGNIPHMYYQQHNQGGYNNYYDYEPYLDGRTRIVTNPHSQFGIGSSITSNDFQRLLDLCETDSELFTHNFEQKFGGIHPPFICGPFSEFYQANKNSKKPIIINIHGPGTENTFFCSLLLSKPEVVRCIKELEIKFWVGEMSKENECHYQSVFGVPIKYPFLAVVGNIGNNFTVIEFVNELCPFNELISKLTKATNHLAAEIESRRLEAQARENERRVLDEQNKLFQQSQREDKMKEIQKQEDAVMAQVTTASKLSTLQDMRRSAIEMAAKLPPEPDAKSVPKPVRIAVAFPDGTRKQRSFSAEQKLDAIFIWVRGEIAGRLTDQTFLDDKSPPFESLEPVIPWTIDSYELVSNYPKKSFSIRDADSTLTQCGLAPGGGLLGIQRIDS